MAQEVLPPRRPWSLERHTGTQHEHTSRSHFGSIHFGSSHVGSSLQRSGSMPFAAGGGAELVFSATAHTLAHIIRCALGSGALRALVVVHCELVLWQECRLMVASRRRRSRRFRQRGNRRRTCTSIRRSLCSRHSEIRFEVAVIKCRISLSGSLPWRTARRRPTTPCAGGGGSGWDRSGRGNRCDGLGPRCPMHRHRPLASLVAAGQPRFAASVGPFGPPLRPARSDSAGVPASMLREAADEQVRGMLGIAHARYRVLARDQQG